MITYTTEQAANALNCDVHKIALLRKCGLIRGIKMGKRGWIFSEEDLKRFWSEYLGEDLSNPENIRVVADLHRAQKKAID